MTEPAATRNPPAVAAPAPEALAQRAGIGFALADVTRLMRSMFDVRMRELGLTGSTWRVLAYLYREDGQTQAQLARLLEVSRAAVGQMIDRLEASGHVERRADQSDRRSWRVHLTAKTHAGVPVLIETVRALEAECFSSLAEDEIKQLGALVARLREHLIVAQPAADAREGK
jgi:MarR family transcriptional regulator for hemolysin